MLCRLKVRIDVKFKLLFTLLNLRSILTVSAVCNTRETGETYTPSPPPRCMTSFMNVPIACLMQTFSCSQYDGSSKCLPLLIQVICGSIQGEGNWILHNWKNTKWMSTQKLEKLNWYTSLSYWFINFVKMVGDKLADV